MRGATQFHGGSAGQRARSHGVAALEGESAAIVKTYGRQELNEPVWPGEFEMPSGKPLADKAGPSHLALDAHTNKRQGRIRRRPVRHSIRSRA